VLTRKSKLKVGAKTQVKSPVKGPVKGPAKIHAKSHSCQPQNQSRKVTPSIEKFTEALALRGFRKSKKRESVLRFLIQESRPLSVDEILSGLHSMRIDKVSLYRMIAAFEEVGIVQSHDLGDRTRRFEICFEGHHHHHVVCQRCNKVDRLPQCSLGSLERSLKRFGYSSISHSLEFFGICISCVHP